MQQTWTVLRHNGPREVGGGAAVLLTWKVEAQVVDRPAHSIEGGGHTREVIRAIVLEDSPYLLHGL